MRVADSQVIRQLLVNPEDAPKRITLDSLERWLKRVLTAESTIIYLLPLAVKHAP